MDNKLTQVLRALTTTEDREKKNNTLVVVFAIIGAVCVIGLVAYLIYRFMKPDYFEDYDDDYDDDEYEEDDEAEAEEGTTPADADAASEDEPSKE